MLLFDKAIRWLFFLINPFIAMLFSFKEYKLPYAKNVFWAFCVFYGFTFAIGAESQGADINRYVAELQYLYSRYDYTTTDIINYFQTSGEIDVLRTFIAFFLSRFTDSQAILTMVYALVFGYFYSRNIWYVLNLLEGKINLITKLFILCLLLAMPIWMINGFRMWTAFHIFIYGLLPFIFENKKDKLVFLFLSVFVHFSFMIPNFIFLTYLLVGSRVYLFFIFFVFSIIVSEIDIGFINQNVERFLPESLLERTASYRNEDVIDHRKEKSANSKMAWYVIWKAKSIKWTFYLMMFYFFLFANREVKLFPYWNRLFALNLLFFSIGNLLSNIPSGGRYLNFSLFLTFIMIILYLNHCKSDHKFKFMVQTLTPVFLLFVIVSIRVGFFSMSLATIFGNPIIAILGVGHNMSLNDVIK